MRYRYLVAVAVGSVLSSGCVERSVSSLEGDEALSLMRAGGGAQSLTVMTRNLYVGADVDAIITALASPDPSDDFPTLLEQIAILGNTDYAARAAAMADEFARAMPAVIGLQEVSEIDIDLTGLGLPIVVDLDFLPILQSELSQRGLNYVVAASVQNLVAAPPIPGAVLSLTDYDVILVDDDRVTVNSTFGKTFDFNVGPVAPGVDLVRGWVWIDAEIGGHTYSIVSTHLESGQLPGLPLLRAAQITEIVTALGAAAPAIVIGDLNDVPGSLMYQVLQGTGFTDVWAALRPGKIGFTCCHLSDLSNKIATLDERIDQVWTRGIGHPRAGVQGQIRRTGLHPSDRIAGPAYKIWPSDHVGVVATLLMPPAKGLIAP